MIVSPSTSLSFAKTSIVACVFTSVVVESSAAFGLSLAGVTFTVTVAVANPLLPSDDKLIYTPALDFSGVDTFTYTIADGNGGFGTATVTVTVQAVGGTPPGFKVAFIADQGSGGNADAVLNVILNEGADMVIHQGDFDYSNNPNDWDSKINSILGPSFPYFASVGNHDTSAWSGYQQKLADRLALIDGADCTGDIGDGIQFQKISYCRRDCPYFMTQMQQTMLLLIPSPLMIQQISK